ncbi:MAG TPA: hypothetical protein VM120_04475 [Bryobacteraceae bacterium]|nr:hypothetical protein [Bryobacteraceae bacterium]
MITQPILIVGGVIGLSLAAVLALAFSKVLRRRPPAAALPPSRRPLRFQPLNRLLRDSDFAFLEGQPGFQPAIAARLRSRRISIYRAYLRHLSWEFQSLQSALREMILSAEQDRSEIAREMLRQHLRFKWGLMEAHMRLAFFGLGIRPLDLTALVNMIDSMRQAAGRLSSPMPRAQTPSLPA